MTDWKKLIDDATETRANEFDSGEYTSIAFAYKSGAWLPNELLLKALEELQAIADFHHTDYTYSQDARDTLADIRRTLETK